MHRPWCARAQRSGRQLPLRGVSTPGHGQGEGPVGSKLSRSDDADDDGRGRSERSERSPLRGKLPPLRSLAHQHDVTSFSVRDYFGKLMNGTELPSIYVGIFPSHFWTASYWVRSGLARRAFALICIALASASAEITFWLASS